MRQARNKAENHEKIHGFRDSFHFCFFLSVWLEAHEMKEERACGVTTGVVFRALQLSFHHCVPFLRLHELLIPRHADGTFIAPGMKISHASLSVRLLLPLTNNYALDKVLFFSLHGPREISRNRE